MYGSSEWFYVDFEWPLQWLSRQPVDESVTASGNGY